MVVLEFKFDIYEDFFKEMFDKLECVVIIIFENSNKIVIVLECYENRFDEGDKVN